MLSCIKVKSNLTDSTSWFYPKFAERKPNIYYVHVSWKNKREFLFEHYPQNYCSVNTYGPVREQRL